MKLSQRLYISLIKRPVGFIGALLALILLSPIIVTVSILLCFTNKGAGVFFTQERPGKGESLFKVIKFKTMTDERDSDGNLLPDDQRLTRIGSFIRKTSIDELPQLVNVLKGDMAFIGPRPLMPAYLPLYSVEQHHRHDVRPGISGWAQVNGRNSISWTEKFKYDVYYVNHISLFLDVKIFFLTVKRVFARKDINFDSAAELHAFNGEN